MKNNKLKAKKGMTLIEVIISVTLLSILIVPLSGLVMSSLKNNKDSEYRQKASYVGQKVLEELKAYDKIILKNDAGERYFQLLDGDKIVKDSTGNTFVGDFERTIYGSSLEPESSNERIYKVNVEIQKDINFQYDDNNNLSEYNNADFRLNFLKENGVDKIQLASNIANSSSIDNEDIMIELSNNLNLKVYKKNNKSPIIDNTKVAPINNKLLLYLESTYTKNTNIEIKNDTSNTIEIYLIKNKGTLGKLNLYSSKGKIILYEENEVDKNQIANMYNYKVTVKDNDENILFEGSSSKNLYIE